MPSICDLKPFNFGDLRLQVCRRWHFQELGLSAFGFKDGGSSGWASCFGLSRRFGSLRRHCSNTRLVVFHDCAQGVGFRVLV